MTPPITTTRRERPRYTVLDSWAFVKGDATDNNVQSVAREMRRSWEHLPNVSVQTFKRHVRAGGAGIPVTCIVARQRLNP